MVMMMIMTVIMVVVMVMMVQYDKFMMLIDMQTHSSSSLSSLSPS